MDRKDQIKAEVTFLAMESLAALERGDEKASYDNVPKVQALLREYATLIPEGDQKNSILASIDEGERLLANGEAA